MPDGEVEARRAEGRVGDALETQSGEKGETMGTRAQGNEVGCWDEKIGHQKRTRVKGIEREGRQAGEGN